jgi:opacity protein-like surface antigen
MRSTTYVLAATLCVGLSTPAAAQSGQTPASAPAAAQTPTAAVVSGPADSQWLASAFLGSNFSASRDEVLNLDTDDGGAGFNWGLQLAYLWGGTVGAETLFDFAPSMDLTTITFDGEPSVNSYMLNLIGALPLGVDDRFQPYISGGIGSIQMLADVFEFLEVQPVNGDITTSTRRVSETRFGTNIGGGLMVFAENLGFRTDLRHYRANGGDLPTEASPEDTAVQVALSGLSYWRASIGLGFRW